LRKQGLFEGPKTIELRKIKPYFTVLVTWIARALLHLLMTTLLRRCMILDKFMLPQTAPPPCNI